VQQGNSSLQEEVVQQGDIATVSAGRDKSITNA
jgi:hypothetical protein